MTTPNPSELFTPFLPSTYNIPEDDDRLKTYLTDNLNLFSDVINDKKIGMYVQGAESFNGEKWFYDVTTKLRNGYQSIARVSSYTNGLILPVPIRNVNPQFVVSLVYGSASKPCTSVVANDGDYFSFMAQGDARISFTMSNKQIIITTDGLRAAYSGFIVIHYIRDGI